jgi:hypothetical protein
MLPVPEEIAGEVLAYLRWKGDAPAQAPAERPRPQRSVSHARARAARSEAHGTIARLLADGADRAGTTILALVATATLSGREVTVEQAAELLGVSEREIVGLVYEMNQLMSPAIGTFTMLIKPPEGERAPQMEWNRQAIVMTAAVAQAMLDAVGEIGDD